LEVLYFVLKTCGRGGFSFQKILSALSTNDFVYEYTSIFFSVYLRGDFSPPQKTNPFLINCCAHKYTARSSRYYVHQN